MKMTENGDEATRLHDLDLQQERVFKQAIKKFEDQEHLLGKGRMKKMRGNILIIVKIYINNTYKVSFLCI
jgi:phage-related protein